MTIFTKSYFGHLYTLSCENATRLNFVEFAKKLIEDTVSGELNWRNEYNYLDGSKIVCLNDEKDIWARIFVIETQLLDGRSRIYVEAGYGTTRDNGNLRFRDANYPSICSAPGDPEWSLAHALWMAVEYQMKNREDSWFLVRLLYPSDGGEPTAVDGFVCKPTLAEPRYFPNTRTATGYVACRTVDEAIDTVKRYFSNRLRKYEIQYHLTGAKLLVADVAKMNEPESIKYCFDEDGYNPYVKAVVLAESYDQAKEYVKSWADDNPGPVWEIGYCPSFNEFFSVRKCMKPLKDIEVNVTVGDTVIGFVFARTKELAKDYIRKKYQKPTLDRFRKMLRPELCYNVNTGRFMCGEIPEDKFYYVRLRKDASDGIVVNEIEYPGVFGIGEEGNGFYSGYVFAKDIDNAVEKATNCVRVKTGTNWYSVYGDNVILSANQHPTRKDIGLNDHVYGGSATGRILANDADDARRIVTDWILRHILPKTMNIPADDDLPLTYDVSFGTISLYGLEMLHAIRMEDSKDIGDISDIRQLGNTIHMYTRARNVDEAKKKAKERLEAMGYYVVC